MVLKKITALACVTAFAIPTWGQIDFEKFQWSDLSDQAKEE